MTAHGSADDNNHGALCPRTECIYTKCPYEIHWKLGTFLLKALQFAAHTLCTLGILKIQIYLHFSRERKPFVFSVWPRHFWINYFAVWSNESIGLCAICLVCSMHAHKASRAVNNWEARKIVHTKGQTEIVCGGSSDNIIIVCSAVRRFGGMLACWYVLVLTLSDFICYICCCAAEEVAVRHGRQGDNCEQHSDCAIFHRKWMAHDVERNFAAHKWEKSHPYCDVPTKLAQLLCKVLPLCRVFLPLGYRCGVLVHKKWLRFVLTPCRLYRIELNGMMTEQCGGRTKENGKSRRAFGVRYQSWDSGQRGFVTRKSGKGKWGGRRWWWGVAGGQNKTLSDKRGWRGWSLELRQAREWETERRNKNCKRKNECETRPWAWKTRLFPTLKLIYDCFCTASEPHLYACLSLMLLCYQLCSNNECSRIHIW